MMIELDEGGIFSVNKAIIYPSRKNIDNKKWRKAIPAEEMEKISM